MQLRLGLIVNPIAGMGGRVGLKGTDGEDALHRARELGAEPDAPRRAELTLRTIARSELDVQIFTVPGPMGEDAARAAGFEVQLVVDDVPSVTGACHTREAARALEAAAVSLLVFVGGDGTARDIMDAIDSRLPVIGVPAGVKMHSAVFATDPRSAGELTTGFLGGSIRRTREAEVMDIDEEAFREGRLSARLYGHVMTPYDPALVQDLKMGSSADEDAMVEAIADRVVAEMQPGITYVIGPGTTTRSILQRLGLPATLLGVDVVRDGELLASDANETEILQLLDEGTPARIVVTPIGGQGYLFGRGNQQISAEVIRRVGRDGLIIVAAKSKLLALGRKPLLVDTGDDTVDAMLRGYAPVIVDYREDSVRKIG